MTEDQIERIVERTVDRLDRQYMAGKMTSDEYDREIATIDRWASQQLQQSI